MYIYIIYNVYIYIYYIYIIYIHIYINLKRFLISSVNKNASLNAYENI